MAVCRLGREGGTPARGPVGMVVGAVEVEGVVDRAVVEAEADGPLGIVGVAIAVLAELRDGDGVVPVRESVLLLVEISGGRVYVDDGLWSARESGRICLSLPNDGLPPRIPYGAPRGAENPLGPAGGARFSGLACADIEDGPLGATGAVKFRDGPLGGGARNPDGPLGGLLALGGDLAELERAGDRSRGVDLVEASLSLSLSRSLNASVLGGDLSLSLSRAGDRTAGLTSRSI